MNEAENLVDIDLSNFESKQNGSNEKETEAQDVVEEAVDSIEQPVSDDGGEEE